LHTLDELFYVLLIDKFFVKLPFPMLFDLLAILQMVYRENDSIKITGFDYFFFNIGIRTDDIGKHVL
jgi:hypothetical protein